MKDNAVIMVFFLFAIVLLLIVAYPTISKKDEHQRRMELIEELNQLVLLQQDIELQQTSEKVDSLRKVINAELRKEYLNLRKK